MPTPPLPAHVDTEHYRLDLLTPADAPALLAHFADPQVTRYLDIDPLTELAEAREILEWAQGLAAIAAGGRWDIAIKRTAGGLGPSGSTRSCASARHAAKSLTTSRVTGGVAG